MRIDLEHWNFFIYVTAQYNDIKFSLLVVSVSFSRTSPSGLLRGIGAPLLSTATLLVSFFWGGWGVVRLSAVSHLVEAPLICHDYCWVLACHWLQEINRFGLSLCCIGRPNSLFFAKWGFPSIHPSSLSILPSFSLYLSLSPSWVSSSIW